VDPDGDDRVSKAGEARKGARRMSEIPAATRRELNAGRVESITLVEILAIDFAELAIKADVGLGKAEGERISAAGGIVPRMREAGRVLFEKHGKDAWKDFAGHRSDTVRGWAAFAIGAAQKMSLAARFKAMRPLADDAHSGVREWAWLALRDHTSAELEEALVLLTPWTRERSANLRRFASEITRPRGVWCTHINALKDDPSPGLAILEPLRADPTKYVQDSVGNWLNDASKSTPAWVRKVCAEWKRGSDHPATTRICTRAMRTLAKERKSKSG